MLTLLGELDERLNATWDNIILLLGVLGRTAFEIQCPLPAHTRSKMPLYCLCKPEEITNKQQTQT